MSWSNEGDGRGLHRAPPSMSTAYTPVLRSSLCMFHPVPRFDESGQKLYISGHLPEWLTGTGRMTDLIRSAGLSCYPEVARSVGLDPRQMMRKARLPLAVLDKPDTPIAVASLRRLLELSAEESGAEDLG